MSCSKYISIISCNCTRLSNMDGKMQKKKEELTHFAEEFENEKFRAARATIL